MATIKSIEEKAKRYDEAIERAESIYNETAIPSATTKGICTYIFPELKESEDERIRKEIITYLSTVDDKELIPYESWIAWLEKHGEQETDEWKEGNIIRHGGILALVVKGRRAMKSNGELFTVQYPKEWVKAVPNEIECFLNELEKQGEQKPAETVKWSPQEESCICQLESLVKEQWRQAEKVHNSVNIKKMSELMFFLKTLNPNKKPQGKSALEAAKEEKVDNQNCVKPADKVEPKFHEGEWVTIKE